MQSKHKHAVIGTIVAVFALATTVVPTEAGGRCPAGESGCTIENAPGRIRDRVNEGASRIIQNPSERGRVRELRDTLKDCVNCGTDAIKEGMDRVTNPRSGGATR